MAGGSEAAAEGGGAFSEDSLERFLPKTLEKKFPLSVCGSSGAAWAAGLLSEADEAGVTLTTLTFSGAGWGVGVGSGSGVGAGSRLNWGGSFRGRVFSGWGISLMTGSGVFRSAARSTSSGGSLVPGVAAGATAATSTGAGASVGVRIAAGSEERRVGKECRSRWSPYH